MADEIIHIPQVRTYAKFDKTNKTHVRWLYEKYWHRVPKDSLFERLCQLMNGQRLMPARVEAMLEYMHEQAT